MKIQTEIEIPDDSFQRIDFEKVREILRKHGYNYYCTAPTHERWESHELSVIIFATDRKYHDFNNNWIVVITFLGVLEDKTFLKILPEIQGEITAEVSFQS